MAKLSFIGNFLSALSRNENQDAATEFSKNKQLAISNELISKTQNVFKNKYESLKKNWDEVQDFYSASKTFEVGFIGRSQVGKSTLINSLLADSLYPRILPSGGIGPLTAISISISYGEKRRLEVKYQPIENLVQMIKDIESIKSQIKEDTTPTKEDRELLKKYFSEISSLVTGQQNSLRSEEYLLQKVKLLTNPSTSIEKLQDQEYKESDLEFVIKVFNALRTGSSSNIYLENNSEEIDSNFKMAINDHSAGCLSPIVQSMTLEWPSEILKSGVVLTDLPGVGVVGDRFPEVTKKWIINKSRSVVFVTDNSGIDEASAKILSESGFIQRLLLEKNDPTLDPIELIIAVTQMDRLLNDHQFETTEQADQLFNDLCKKMESHITNQLKAYFEGIIYEENKEDLQKAKAENLKSLLDRVTVIPLSANEFIKLSTNSKNSQFSNIKITNVPTLKKDICALALSFQEKYESRIQARLLYVQNTAKATREAAEAEFKNIELVINNNSMTQQFEQSFKPVLLTMETNDRNYLKDTTQNVASNIREFLEILKSDALKGVYSYCDTELKDAHWCTIKATLKRGGAFVGAKTINIPQSTINLLLERVAVSFAPLILEKISKRMDIYTTEYQQKIKKIYEWLISEDISEEKKYYFTKRLNDYTTSNEYAKEQLENELNKITEKIRILITHELNDAIQNSSAKFIASTDSSGLGVKKRMIESVRNMMKDVIIQSCKTIEDFLIKETIQGSVMEQCYAIERIQKAEIKKLADELDLEAKAKENERREQWMRDVGPYVEGFKQLEYKVDTFHKKSS